MTVKPANHSYRQRTKGTSLTGGKGMGYVYAEIELTNEADLALNRHGYLPDNEVRKVTSRALVDSGAWDLVINDEVQKRLNLPVLGRRVVKTADETLLEVDIVGPVEVRFEDHATTVRAIIIPNTSEVLLGAFPLEGLDAFIDPKGERLVVNPEDIRPVKQVSLSI
jgi:clan AA aspartic protease